MAKKLNNIINQDTGSKLDVINTFTVWSNGTKIRRYQGQDKNSTQHHPDKGFKKMIAILVEIDE
ncbi:hypothetical protein IEN91_05285 [Bacillus velezensis]|uniref:hypothetical protein n=1 Tax=Bacillus velezensis TaxID=492670 RepID=UPI0018C6ADCE|nr:hypothetical protein [Bacillus velezensis]QPK89852.1 hypothetical protein IEN91_05285 [Bacillus velezensis]